MGRRAPFYDDLVAAILDQVRGRFVEAIALFRQAMQREGRGHFSGLSRSALFAALAEAGDPTALDLLRELPPLPVPGQLNLLGSWASLERTVQGLAMLGRDEQVAALHPPTEALVETGAWCYFGFHLFRTAAGITAAAARKWPVAEEHHRIAIHQADSAPYRTAQPEARAWYAEMLLGRGDPADRDRAVALLGEALSMHEALGMPLHARRTASRIVSLG